MRPSCSPASAAGIVKILGDKRFEEFLELKLHNIPNITAMAVAEMGV